MNSYRLIEHIEKFLVTIQEQGYLLKTINSFHDYFNLAISNFDQVISSGKTNNLRNAVSNIRMALQQLQARQIFTSVNNIEYACVAFDKDDGDQQAGGVAKVLLSHLSEFSIAYKTYLDESRKNEDLLFVLLASGDRLSKSLDVVINILSDVKTKLRGNLEKIETEELAKLSLFLESEVDFSRFTEKLSAINRIYLELCSLLKISPLENPIVISKVESGSTWAELLAYPKIISLMVSLVERTVDYFYRTFTIEGKIVALPRKLEAVEEVLELRRKLAAVGVNTSKIDEEIEKSTTVIAEELNRLLVGEPKITLNSKVISISARVEKKYLEASEKLLLPIGTPDWHWVSQPPSETNEESSSDQSGDWAEASAMPQTEESAFDALVQLVNGNTITAERLIRLEGRLFPNASRLELIERALERLFRDRQ